MVFFARVTGAEIVWLPRVTLIEGEPVAGSGDQSRRFIYVEDLADGVERALAPEAANRIYNLAGSETTTIPVRPSG